MLTYTIKIQLNFSGFTVQHYEVQMEPESIKASLFKTIHLIRPIRRSSNKGSLMV